VATARHSSATDFDVVVIGAGFGGMYMLHKLRQLHFSVRVFETGTGVGGTWYWNRYPGARCDVESLEYQYAFSDELQREWTWTERYATQPEILRYANHVADRFDLRRDIQFSTRVTEATFVEGDDVWAIRTDRGDHVRARYLVTAAGCLSASRVPDFPGVDRFTGESYHTGQWPHTGVDFTGKRVGVIGTGSSAIQSIPVIAAQAKSLTIFQRTPNFSVPAQNWTLATKDIAAHKETFLASRQQAANTGFGSGLFANLPSALATDPVVREHRYEELWQEGGAIFLIAFNDLLFNQEANDTAADFVRRKIRSIVKDPEVAELLCPFDHPLGTKRICVDTDYYETFNRDNVKLVDVRRAPIEEINERGLRTRDASYEFDVLVYATGFDAMTGPLLRIDIRGRGGESLAQKWEAGPKTYLGLSMVGFPNLFTITGPGSPSVLSNMIASIEQHVDWIADCLAHLREEGYATMEAEAEAEEAWVKHVNEVADMTLFPRANSWYMGANIPGKPRVFMPYVGGIGLYRQKCDEVAANGYQGYRLTHGDARRRRTA
jgi:cyclohexanone monooxygenase